MTLTITDYALARRAVSYDDNALMDVTEGDIAQLLLDTYPEGSTVSALSRQERSDAQALMEQRAA